MLFFKTSRLRLILEIDAMPFCLIDTKLALSFRGDGDGDVASKNDEFIINSARATCVGYTPSIEQQTIYNARSRHCAASTPF